MTTQRKLWPFVLLVLLVGLVSGALGGWLVIRWLPPQAAVSGFPSGPIAGPSAPQAGGAHSAFTEVARRLNPTVVNVNTTYATVRRPFDEDLLRRFFGFPFPDFGERRPEGLGSGFIVRSDGLILTNQHVVENAKEIKIALYDKREFAAKILASDRSTDLALLKIPAQGLPVAPLGDSDALEPGDWVIAIGNPFRFDHTVTAGVVSALTRPIQIEDRNYPGGVIQTDADIGPGNSGGPLADLKGRVVGINTAIFASGQTAQSIGFAVPINTAKQLLNKFQTEGKVEWPWLGIWMDEITPEIAKEQHLPVSKGILIKEVVSDGPAAKAGLKAGDVIKSFDGKKVTSPQKLQDLIRSRKVGEVVEIEVLRWARTRWVEESFRVKTAETPENLPTEE